MQVRGSLAITRDLTHPIQGNSSAKGLVALSDSQEMYVGAIANITVRCCLYIP
jgi:hypothetical protein